MATLAKRGSGTPVTSGTTWATVTNAVDGTPGTNPSTMATWTNTQSLGTGYIEVSGYDFSSIPATATLNSISVTMRHLETNTARVPTVAFQVYDGATPIGASVPCVVNVSAHDDTATRNPTLAQLKSATFKVRATATRTNVTTAGNFHLDHIDVVATYTPLVPNQGSATTTYTETVTAVGAAPIPPPPEGTRATEANAARATEGAEARVLENYVLALPNEGTAAVGWAEATSAAGKRTPKGATTTAHVWAPAAAGKRTAKGAVTTAHAWAPAAGGKRAPKAGATVAYAETLTAVGRKAQRGTVTTAHTWTATAAGSAPAPLGVRVLESNVERVTEDANDRSLESAPSGPGGSAVVAWNVAPAAVGKRAPKATVVTAHAWTQIAQGVKPILGQKQGSGLVYHSWLPSAVGRRTPKGTRTITVTWATSAAGLKPKIGSATTAWSMAPAAAGKRAPKGLVVVTDLWLPTASGRRQPRGGTITTYRYVVAADGFSGRAGYIQGYINGQQTEQMMWGTEVVVEFLLTPP